MFKLLIFLLITGLVNNYPGVTGGVRWPEIGQAFCRPACPVPMDRRLRTHGGVLGREAAVGLMTP